jgi:pimeloyl-[acyl-carrier protein] methyl ester esterase
VREKKKKDLVLIHGWGFGRWIWESFIPCVEDRWCVTSINLPGYGGSGKLVFTDNEEANINQIVKRISPNVPKNSIVLAWSLGGLIATKLAQVRRDIKALVLLASSPCFLNKPGWRGGIEPDDFNRLASRLSEDKTKTLQEFAGLVTMGDKHPKQTRNILCEHSGDNAPNLETLQAGLHVLSSVDLRRVMANQHCSIGMIFGENDVLVRRSTAKAVRAIRPDIKTIEITESGHAPFLSHPQETADALTKLMGSLL